MRFVPLVAATALVLALPRPGYAQVKFGGQLSFGSQSIGFGVGARADVALVKFVPAAKDISIIGAFDYFFPGSSYGVSPSYWEINVDGAYHFALPNTKLGPYAGAGLNLAHASASACYLGTCASASSSNVGLNLLAGTTFDVMPRITPFAEVRLELGGGKAVVVSAGVLF